MKRVHFLTNADPIPAYALTPVRLNRRRLRDLGYWVREFTRPTERLADCDILCLLSKPAMRAFGSRGPVIGENDPLVTFLKTARTRADRIVWLDDSDSTSVTNFELLPRVDAYLKKQLFADLSNYRSDLYGGRLFTDLYHREFGIADSAPFRPCFHLPQDQEDKVGLSWNIGLGDMMNAFGARHYLRRHLPRLFPVSYDISCVEPGRARPVDVFLRTSANLARETVAFHRQETLRRLSAFLAADSRRSGMSGDTVQSGTPDAARLLPAEGGRMPRRQLLEITASTKVMPSPFGWGEIGVRDYEAFIHGALLIKPDMSHMITWPDIFHAGETYVSVRWNFEDFEVILKDALADDARRIRIARNGQEAYRQSISREGGERFCHWFARQIGGRRT